MPLDVPPELIERARSGGGDLERLVAAVWPEAYRIAFAILHDRGLAEDAAQEACASMARSLLSLNDPARFRAWCHKIVVNHAISVARSRDRTRSIESSGEPAASFDSSDALDLYAALAALPVVQRGAVLLHYYAGLNSAEIAQATGLPRSTVRFHLMLARRALRAALSERETARAARPHQEALT